MGKMPYIIYTDLECLIKRIEGCANNTEITSTAKIGEHIPCGCSMSTIWEFHHIKKQTYFIPRKRLHEKFL